MFVLVGSRYLNTRYIREITDRGVYLENGDYIALMDHQKGQLDLAISADHVIPYAGPMRIASVLIDDEGCSIAILPIIAFRIGQYGPNIPITHEGDFVAGRDCLILPDGKVDDLFNQTYDDVDHFARSVREEFDKGRGAP